MRVHDSNQNAVTIGTRQTGSTQAANSERRDSAAVNGAGDHDRLSLSDLGSLVRSVSGDTPARTARVDQLAATYRSGNYRPDASAVSRSIVADGLQAG